MRAALAEGLARGVVRDRALRDGAAVAIVQVEVSRDLQIARVYWEPMDDRDDPERLRRALDRRRGVLLHHVNAYLRQRVAPSLEFHQIVPGGESGFVRAHDEAMDILRREEAQRRASSSASASAGRREDLVPGTQHPRPPRRT